MSKKNACKKFQSVIFSAISIVFLFLLFGKNTNLQAKSSKTETYKEFIDGYNKTTLELFYFINSAPFDLTICPFSIENTLLMAYMGAQKETSNAFEKALSLNLPKSKIPKVFEKESSDLSSRIKGKTSYTFSQANAVWVANSINILSSYKKIVKKDFNSDVFNIDFTHPTLATYKINTWISNQTKKAIPTFLATNNIPESTTMMLTSACVFKGQWKYPFPTQLTAKKPFHSHSDGSDKTLINMMQLSQKLDFFEDDNFAVVSLPIKKHIDQADLSLILVLPKGAEYTNPYGTFYSKLQDSGKSLTTYLDQQEKEKLTVFIPRFRVSTSISIKESLSLMGLKNAFGKEANFSGISGKSNLALNDVLTSSTFQINEFGVAATAAASASFTLKSEKQEKSSKTVKFDRPFLYFLMDTESKLLLFLGEISHPK